MVNFDIFMLSACACYSGWMTSLALSDGKTSNIMTGAGVSLVVATVICLIV